MTWPGSEALLDLDDCSEIEPQLGFEDQDQEGSTCAANLICALCAHEVA